MGITQTDLVASEGNLISRLIELERAVRALERQQLEVTTLSTLASDLGAVYVKDGAVALDENGLTINAPENSESNIFFKDGDVTIAEFSAGWLFTENSGLGIYGIAKSATERGDVTLVGYNYNRTKYGRFTINSLGEAEIDLSYGSNSTLHSQAIKITTNVDVSNDENDSLQLIHQGGTGVSAGFGVAMAHYLWNAVPASKKAGRFLTRWLAPTTSSEDSIIAFEAMASGTLAERLAIVADDYVQSELPYIVKHGVNPGTVPSGYAPVQVGVPQDHENIVSTTSETIIGEISLSAGALSDEGFLKMDFAYRYLNNNDDDGFSLIGYIDSTEVIRHDIANAVLAQDTVARLGFVEIWLSNADAQNSQRIQMKHDLSAPVTTNTPVTRGGAFNVALGNLSSVDLSTGSHTFYLKAKLNSSSANHSFRSLGGPGDGPYAL